MNIYNDNWLGKTLNVIHSNDSTLLSKQGLVIDETKKDHHNSRRWQISKTR